MFVKVLRKNSTMCDIIHTTKFTSFCEDKEKIAFDICDINGFYETSHYLKENISFIFIMNDEGKTIDKIDLRK